MADQTTQSVIAPQNRAGYDEEIKSLRRMREIARHLGDAELDESIIDLRRITQNLNSSLTILEGEKITRQKRKAKDKTKFANT